MTKQAQERMMAGLELSAESPLPMYRQIYQFLRQAILKGRLRPGQRLPATRALATELGVSRNTVICAFDDLLGEGYLEGRRGSGTFVTNTLPERMLQASGLEVRLQKSNVQVRTVSKRTRVVAGKRFGAPVSAPSLRPFQHGWPALFDFPYDVWIRVASHQLRSMPFKLLGYADAAGYGPLREAIASYVRTARAVRCEADQVLIVSGTQQALDLIARVLVDPGDSVWVEDPGYFGVKGAMQGAGVRLTPVPIDEEGLDVEYGKSRDKNARIIYVTPSYQYPLGVTMTLSRRLKLLEWAQRAGAWILEDDYDSEYRYAGRPLSSMQGLDILDRVIYLGSFSKMLFPALRLGYLIVPRNLVSAFLAAKSLCDRHNPLFEQMVLATFIEDGHFGRHVRRMRVLYQERQEALVDAVRTELKDHLTVHHSAAGMHLVGWLESHSDEKEVSLRAAEHKVTVTPLSSFTLRHGQAPGLVLGYAAFTKKQIRESTRRLAKALK